MSRDTDDRQKAFTGLLAHPVVDRRRDPEMFALVRSSKHRRVLVDWFSERLGYRLVVTDAAARLFRLPLENETTTPRRYGPPGRRVLVLAVLAAAAAEDTEDITTTQDLSDRVRALTRHEDVDLAPYEPDRFVERQLFVKAVGLLVGTGALRPSGRGSDEERESWASHRNSVGGAYDVERELLLRMVDPAALAAALGQRPTGILVPESNTRFRLMRRLLELPVCLFADLTEPERTYLTSQKYRILAWCEEMTGWVAEQRAEGLALIAGGEDQTDLPFPRVKAVDFAALMVLDELRRRQDPRGMLDDDEVDRAVADVRARHPKAKTKELNDDMTVRTQVLELLRALDLVRPTTDGRWWISPVAARFRDPRVVAVSSTLDGDDR
ncbi:hypothetical protein GCM10009765_15740 [Fodinicola feengrottensis]|uniref:TIGR02678 family protein n=1 Tax=Fodinicola feengrottensis TaxID=435914 RepID=A0ABN2G9P5_9ACTN